MYTYNATLRGPLKVPGYIDPDDVTVVQVFWGAPTFAANTVYREGHICKPTTDNGFYYETTVNGKTGDEPATWAQDTQVSGTVTFTAVPWDLWLLPDQTLQALDGPNPIPASEWFVTNGVTISAETNDSVSSSVSIDLVPDGVTTFDLTVQARKNTGERLSRTFRYKVNDQ